MDMRQGNGIGTTSVFSCIVTLPLAQPKLSLHQAAVSDAHPSHRNLLVIILRVDLMPGCANLYTDSNICLWCATGTRGLKLRHIALEQLLPHPEQLNLQAVTLDHLLDCLAPCLLLRKLGKLGQNPGSGSKFNVVGSTTLILMLGLDSTGRHK